jgi:hypothetical protein
MTGNLLGDMVRKAIDLNVRYYNSIGRLTLDYWKEVFAAVASTTNSAAAAGNSSARPAAPAKPAVMVIEAEIGSIGIGVFMVENHLGTEVDSAVVASAFKDPQAMEIHPSFTFDPPRVVLKPGEQILVRVTTPFGPDLEPDVRYNGEFVVPDLKGTRIPVVLRSRKRQ